MKNLKNLPLCIEIKNRKKTFTVDTIHFYCMACSLLLLTFIIQYNDSEFIQCIHTKFHTLQLLLLVKHANNLKFSSSYFRSLNSQLFSDNACTPNSLMDSFTQFTVIFGQCMHSYFHSWILF